MKQNIFASFAAELQPDAILATNTSSISITKIAASAIPNGVNATSEEGKKCASRVVGVCLCILSTSRVTNHIATGLHFFNPVPVMVSHSRRGMSC